MAKVVRIVPELVRRAPRADGRVEDTLVRAASGRSRDRAAALRHTQTRAGTHISSPARSARERAHTVALAEKAALAKVLQETLNLALSDTKTAITPVTNPMRFLGHHVRVQRNPMYGWGSKCVIPKDRSKHLRSLARRHFVRDTRCASLEKRLGLLNPLLRGWSAYYRHAWGAKRVFADLDRRVWWTIRRWLRAKHARIGMRRLYARYAWRKPGGRSWRWRDGCAVLFETVSRRVERCRHGWMKTPDFASTSMESPVHSERCTPGSVRGARKPTGASR